MLLRLFEYCSETGVLTYHKETRRRKITRGAVAGSRHGAGYIQIGIGQYMYKAHRIVWKMVYGEDPEVIDHLDGNNSNNKLSNLSNGTQAENTRNTKLRSDNILGIPGITEDPKWLLWRVRIGGEYVGEFSDFFEACCARKSAELRLGYHENHGR